MLNIFSVKNFRNEFPILNLKLPNGKNLIYFDNAATTHKPKKVIESITNFYTTSNANIFRGMHFLGNKATQLCEDTRAKIAKYTNSGADEIVFTKGTTDGLNLLANCLGKNFLNKNSEILLSISEHHSNIVPWQIAAKKAGAQIKFIPLTNQFELDMDVFKSMLSNKTSIVSIQHISNISGHINPIKDISTLSHQYGAQVIIDGAETLAHTKIDVQEIDCDFFVTSFHKCFGPTGIGFMYGKHELLEKIDPYQTGGNMVNKVSIDDASFKESPTKFEAGTLDLSGIAACEATIDFLNDINWSTLNAHENNLTKRAFEILDGFNNIEVIANRKNNSGIISFNINRLHSHDVATIFDSEGIAVRSGNHCCQPFMRSLGINSTVRLSFAGYNTIEEVEYLQIAIEKCLHML